MTSPSPALSQISWQHLMVGVVIMVGVVLVAVALRIDLWIGTKSALLGISLNWLSNWLVWRLSQPHRRYRMRRQMLHRLYLGMMLKWLLTLVGFALIFTLAKPMNTLIVLLGYLLMQMGYSLLLSRAK